MCSNLGEREKDAKAGVRDGDTLIKTRTMGEKARRKNMSREMTYVFGKARSSDERKGTGSCDRGVSFASITWGRKRGEVQEVGEGKGKG